MTAEARLRQRRAAIERDRLRDEWAGRGGLRQSHTCRTDPVPWLLGKRTPYSGTTPNGWGWFDHGTRWTQGGKPYCLVGQPYQLNGDDLRELLALEVEHGLDVVVSTSPAWHYPGGVLSVIVKRADAEDRAA